MCGLLAGDMDVNRDNEPFSGTPQQRACTHPFAIEMAAILEHVQPSLDHQNSRRGCCQAVAMLRDHNNYANTHCMLVFQETYRGILYSLTALLYSV